MNKKLAQLMLFTIILFCVSISGSSQIYVKIRPVIPIVVRTDQPSPNHVWIDEEWTEERGTYRYSGGHWENPPHRGDRWYPGHWNHHKEHGDQWIHGRWGRDRERH